jgi:peptidyl-prolyl cis-trans isomerase C
MRQQRARSIMAAAVVALTLVGILAFVGAGCSKDKAKDDQAGKGTLAGGKESTKLIAKVDGKKITDADVAKETERIAAQMGGQMNPQQLESMKGAFRRQALENMISRTLLEEAVKKEGVTVAPADVEAQVTQIKKNFPSEQDFATRLQSMGMTVEDFQKEIESGLAFQALLGKHTGNVAPATEADMKAFYESNPTEFQQPERVRASHILVTVGKDDTPDQKSEKLARITKIRSDLKGGADFAQTATQYSDCPSKERGGDLGYFEKNQMVAPFANAAFALKVGELSDIVTTDFGYHIIKVADHQMARSIPFEEAKQNIATYLDGQQKQAAVNTYIETLRAAAKIEYADTTGMGAAPTGQ